MGSSVSTESSGLINKKNCPTENNRDSECMIERIFPWLQNKAASKIHDDAKHVRLITVQTKSKNQLLQSTCKETKVWSHILEKV